MFGKGLLYVIGLPFFLVALAIFAVIGLIIFIFQIIKSVIYFFTGQKFFPELPEDKELRLLKEDANQPAPANNVMQETPVVENERVISPFVNVPNNEPITPREPVIPPQTIEEACFNKPEPKPEPMPEPVQEKVSLNSLLEEEPIKDEPIPEEKETLVETNEPLEDEEELMEQLETYVPRSSTYSSVDDDDDTESGVDINYDL